MTEQTSAIELHLIELESKIAFQEDTMHSLHEELLAHQRKIEQLQRQCEVLRAERDQARARVDSAVKLLTSIHSCMYPSAVKMGDGRLMFFRPENPHEYLQALSDRIRTLPDEMVARGVVDA